MPTHPATGTLQRHRPEIATIVDARGVEAYPIASFTHAVIDARGLDANGGRSLREFLRWVLHEIAANQAAGSSMR